MGQKEEGYKREEVLGHIMDMDGIDEDIVG